MLQAPVAVGGGFDATKVGVVAVEVDVGGIFASAGCESAGIHYWAEEEVVLGRQGVALQELEQCEWSCGLVAVNPTGEVDGVRSDTVGASSDEAVERPFVDLPVGVHRKSSCAGGFS